jgi:hypothetical protein
MLCFDGVLEEGTLVGGVFSKKQSPHLRHEVLAEVNASGRSPPSFHNF